MPFSLSAQLLPGGALPHPLQQDRLHHLKQEIVSDSLNLS